MNIPSFSSICNRSRAWCAFLLKHRNLKGAGGFERVLVSLSPFERLLLYVLALVMAGSAFYMLAVLNEDTTTTVPSRGGSLTEGIVGTPRFVNPLLATSDADRDLTELVYSGLMRAKPDNTLAPDLAESYTISNDDTVYTFTLRSNATFQDGTPVTAHDVVYTVQTAQNPAYKSVKRMDWEGVKVEEVDPHTVRFTLPHPYAPFLEAATMGILPSHLWENISPNDFAFDRLNVQPVGSGPYRISKVNEDSHGTPLSYTLKAFRKFTLGDPLIPNMRIKFFSSDEDAMTALRNGNIESLAGISTDVADKVGTDTKVLRRSLPRIFGVFFNQSKNPVLADATVRKALDQAVSRQDIIDQALNGYGVPEDSPIPPDVFTTRAPAAYTDTLTQAEHISEATSTLEKAGWKYATASSTVRTKGKQDLAFSLATADTPELTKTANLLASEWKAVGAKVTVQVFSSADLNTSVIRPRDYDALLFGEVVGRSADVYAFWHSSQRNDPGLNLALYANTDTDKLLSSAREESDAQKREADLANFEKLLAADHPAIFLYTPDFLYAIPKNLYGVSLGSLTTPAERFLNVYEWHRETERVWDIFLK